MPPIAAMPAASAVASSPAPRRGPRPAAVHPQPDSEHTVVMREAPVRGPAGAPRPDDRRHAHAQHRPHASLHQEPQHNPYDVLPSLDAPFSPPPPVVAHVTAPTPPPHAASARGFGQPNVPSFPPPSFLPGPMGADPYGTPAPPPVMSPAPPMVSRAPSVAPPPNALRSMAPPSMAPPAQPLASAYPPARRSTRPPAGLPLPSTFLPHTPTSYFVPVVLLGGPLLLAMLVIAVLSLG